MTERAIENNQEMKVRFLNQTTFLNELRRDRNNSYISNLKKWFCPSSTSKEKTKK
jgi:hypothetical protein